MFQIRMLFCAADSQFTVWFVPPNTSWTNLWKLLGTFDDPAEAASFEAELAAH